MTQRVHGRLGCQILKVGNSSSSRVRQNDRSCFKHLVGAGLPLERQSRFIHSLKQPYWGSKDRSSSIIIWRLLLHRNQHPNSKCGLILWRDRVCAVEVHDRQDSRVGRRTAVGSRKQAAIGVEPKLKE
jgi:hypothetical protein